MLAIKKYINPSVMFIVASLVAVETVGTPTTTIFHPNDWMRDLKSIIGDKPLNQIFIPGTHDSGTYSLSDTIAKNAEIPTELNYLKYLFGLGYIVNSVVKKLSIAQDRTIEQQLNDGIRFLDLRVSYNDSKKDFYIVHGLFGPPLADVLAQIKTFAERRQREILIIQIGDMRYMPNGEKDYAELARRFKDAFAGRIFLRSDVTGPSATLNQLWAKNKQIFLIHDRYDQMHNLSNDYKEIMWPRDFLLSKWANKDNVQELKATLDTFMRERPDKGNGNNFNVVQSQLTPNADTIKKSLIPFSHNPGSLKELADLVKAQLSSWLANWQPITPNIIILDYADEKTSEQIIKLNGPGVILKPNNMCFLNGATRYRLVERSMWEPTKKLLALHR